MYFDGNIVDDAAAAIGFSQTIGAQGRAFRPRTSFKLTQLGVIDLTIKNLAYHQYWSSPLRAAADRSGCASRLVDRPPAYQFVDPTFNSILDSMRGPHTLLYAAFNVVVIISFDPNIA